MTSWEEQGKEHGELDTSRAFFCSLETTKSWSPRQLYQHSSFRNTKHAEVTEDTHEGLMGTLSSIWKRHTESRTCPHPKHYILQKHYNTCVSCHTSTAAFFSAPLEKAVNRCSSKSSLQPVLPSSFQLSVLVPTLSPCPSPPPCPIHPPSDSCRPPLPSHHRDIVTGLPAAPLHGTL